MLRRGSARPALNSTEALRRASATVLVVLAARTPADAAHFAAAAPRQPDGEELARWRGRIDAHACMTRYSDPEVFARLSPKDGVAQRLFTQLEQARVDALGSAGLPGVCANLAAWHAAMCLPIGADTVRAARVRFGAPTTGGAATNGPTSSGAAADWRDGVTPQAAELIEAMAGLRDDQAAFAVQALRLVSLAAPAAPFEPVGGAEPAGGAGSVDAAAPPAAAVAADAAAGGAPLVAIRAAIDAPRGIPAPFGDAARSDAEMAGTAANPKSYRAYTRRFDQVCAARPPDAAQRAALQHEMRRLASARANFARWARLLQRHLLGRQECAWRFDLAEGVVDAARLVRAVTAPLQPLLFKRALQREAPLAAVTLLIDCSGSMRGVPIATAAGCADLLASVLERCRVRLEILGFTTRAWRGGRSRQQWLADGRPADPGRLTDLKHIVFKNGDLPWRRTRPRLLAMLQEDLLKENVDGEALLWAVERLSQRSEARRLLVVISDGAPRDAATAASNAGGYLERHLRQVITAVEQGTAVELLAIGIGHDVGDYYRRAFTVTGPENLGETLVRQLIPLLHARARRRSARERARRPSA